MPAPTTGWAELHDSLQETGEFQTIAGTQLMQFGTAQKPLIGANWIPETKVVMNTYKEKQIRYRVFPALDSARYSPAQMQPSGLLQGEFLVDLGYQNTADQLTANDLDALRLALENDQVGATSGEARLIDFMSNMTYRLVLKNEMDRWESLIMRRVTRRGTAGYSEDVEFYAEPGNQIIVNQDGDWSGTEADPKGWYSKYDSGAEAFDPITEVLLPAKDRLEDLGYRIDAIVMPRVLGNAFQRNPLVERWSNSRVTVDINANLSGISQRPTRQIANDLLFANDLPAITVYNTGYATETGYRRFMTPVSAPNDLFDYIVIIANVDRESELYIEEEDRSILLDNVIGYHAIGTVPGMSSPGRRIFSEAQMQHPMGIYAECIQASLPVIQHPQGIMTLAVPKRAKSQDQLDAWKGSGITPLITKKEYKALNLPVAA